MKCDIFSSLTIFILYNGFFYYFCALLEVGDSFYIWLLLDIFSCRSDLAYGDFFGHLFCCDLYMCRLGMQCILVSPCVMRCAVRSNEYIFFSVDQYTLASFSFWYIPLVHGIRASIQ